jgi:hypothetical protein
MRPDPRVDGALQRTILSKIRARLERHEVDRTFNELETLPRPRPFGEIKEIIYGYSQRSQTPEHWPSAINALTKLDYFLLHDNPQVRDQEALELLIDSLEGWGQHLANNTQTSDEQLAEAAGFFFEGLSYARELGESDQQMSRANDLATHYIQTALELAQINLKGDLTNTSSVYTVEQAFEWFERILLLREHQGRHEEQVKSALHAHVEELTKAGQWDRAHSILNNLGPLPFRHLIMQNHTVFAKWHLESAFDEVDTCLAEQNLEAAFNRLDWLVNVYKIPKKIWNEYKGNLKEIVSTHCQTWLHQKTWPLAPQALTQLAQFIPNDDEITAWRIDALCQWGAAMHQENNFAEAISTYQEALVMASQREVVAVADIEAPLLEAQLAHAQDYLTQDNLPGAIECYRHVLNKPAEHLERGQAIRQALKDYRDKALQSPPDWDKAQNALNILHDLNLLNDQVLVWQQEVILQKMAADLEKRNVDGAFAGLSSLEELDYPLPMDDIKQVFFEYAQRWTEGDGWSLAISTLERLGQTFENEATLRGWISQMLTKLGDILEKQGNMAGATIAFRTAVKFS